MLVCSRLCAMQNNGWSEVQIDNIKEWIKGDNEADQIFADDDVVACSPTKDNEDSDSCDESVFDKLKDLNQTEVTNIKTN